MFLFNLIQKKEYNEFIKKEIYEFAQTKQKDLGKFTGYLIRTKLIPERMNKEVENPQFMVKNDPSTTKVYEIAERGFNLAKKLWTMIRILTQLLLINTWQFCLEL